MCLPDRMAAVPGLTCHPCGADIQCDRCLPGRIGWSKCGYDAMLVGKRRPTQQEKANSATQSKIVRQKSLYHSMSRHHIRTRNPHYSISLLRPSYLSRNRISSLSILYCYVHRLLPSNALQSLINRCGSSHTSE